MTAARALPRTPDVIETNRKVHKHSTSVWFRCQTCRAWGSVTTEHDLADDVLGAIRHHHHCERPGS